MSCQDERYEQIHRYLDEELSPEEAAEFKAHLTACAACRIDFEELHEAQRRLQHLEWVKAPHLFTESLLDRLDSSPIRKRRNWRVPLMKYSGIAAAAMLVLGTGIMVAQPNDFTLQAQNTSGLIVADGKVIVPEGSVYNGDLLIQNGDIEVRGKVNGNVTAYNGRVYRAASADISGETAEVDQLLEKIVFYGKQLWTDVKAMAQ
jgi:hypothetical protein